MFLKKVKSSEVVHEQKQLHLDRLSLTKKKEIAKITARLAISTLNKQL